TMSSLRNEPGFGNDRMSTLLALGACLAALIISAPVACASETAASAQTTFDSPQHALDALVGAAEKSDEGALVAIFGPDGDDIIHTGEPARDKKIRAEFVARARQQKRVSIDPKSPDHAVLVIGKEHWPFPDPLVRQDG